MSSPPSDGKKAATSNDDNSGYEEANGTRRNKKGGKTKLLERKSLNSSPLFSRNDATIISASVAATPLRNKEVGKTGLLEGRSLLSSPLFPQNDSTMSIAASPPAPFRDNVRRNLHVQHKLSQESDASGSTKKALEEELVTTPKAPAVLVRVENTQESRGATNSKNHDEALHGVSLWIQDLKGVHEKLQRTSVRKSAVYGYGTRKILCSSLAYFDSLIFLFFKG